MVGYCAIGSDSTPITPASMTPKATIHAKMGRSMKKRDIFRSASIRWRELLRRTGDDGNRRARFGVRTARDDQAIAGLQAACDPPLIAYGLCHFEHARLGPVLNVDHQRGRATFFVAGNGLLRREYPLRIDAFDHPGADIHARQQNALGLGKLRAMLPSRCFGPL